MGKKTLRALKKKGVGGTYASTTNNWPRLYRQRNLRSLSPLQINGSDLEEINQVGYPAGRNG